MQRSYISGELMPAVEAARKQSPKILSDEYGEFIQELRICERKKGETKRKNTKPSLS